MAKHKYVCPTCGNEVPAEQVDRRVRGTKSHARILNAPVCECRAGDVMDRVEFTPQRRDISRQTGRL